MELETEGGTEARIESRTESRAVEMVLVMQQQTIETERIEQAMEENRKTSVRW